MALKYSVVPAILVNTCDLLLQRLQLSKHVTTSIQIDIMDNIFVPNKSIQPDEISKSYLAGFEVEFHLMVSDPFAYLKKLSRYFTGVDITYQFHIEAFDSDEDLFEAIASIKDFGSKVHVAVSPDTQIEKIEPFISFLDGVLIMTVYPGFSGQSYLPSMEHKIEYLRKRYPNMSIEVDGGINKETILRALKAGANRFCVSSAFFSSISPLDAFRELEELVLRHTKQDQ